MKPLKEEYPELAKEVAYIELTALSMITRAKRKILKSKKGTSCPYPAQCMIEMLIAELQTNV